MRTSRTSSRSLVGEAGFTIIESLVAMFLVAVGVFAVLTVFAGASAGVHGGEREAEASAVGQRALQQMLARPWSELVNCTSTLPAHGTTIDDPTYWLTTGATPRYKIKSNFKLATSADATGAPAAGEPVAASSVAGCAASSTVDGTGVIAGPLAATSVTGSRLTGWKVFRFVTWYDEECGASLNTQVDSLLSGIIGLVNALLTPILNTLRGIVGNQVTALCGTGTDAKRIVVAVVAPRLANGAVPALPVYLTSIVPNPSAGAGIDGTQA